jgi:hypothetical protein
MKSTEIMKRIKVIKEQRKGKMKKIKEHQVNNKSIKINDETMKIKNKTIQINDKNTKF